MIRLKYERVRLGLSQSSLATAAGHLDQSKYCQVELGRYRPDPVVLGRLAEVLGLPPDVDLLAEVEIVKPETLRPRDACGRYVKVRQ